MCRSRCICVGFVDKQHTIDSETFRRTTTMPRDKRMAGCVCVMRILVAGPNISRTNDVNRNENRKRKKSHNMAGKLVSCSFFIGRKRFVRDSIGDKTRGPASPAHTLFERLLHFFVFLLSSARNRDDSFTRFADIYLVFYRRCCRFSLFTKKMRFFPQSWMR